MQAYQVPQSSQVESPSRYHKEGEPSLRHEEIVEKDGSFAAEENLGDGIGEKQVPLVEKPLSMVSVGITEFVKNMAVDEDDEVDSQRCAMDTVEGYTVKPESMAILRKILTRHGDIAKNCTVSIMEFRSGLLEMICGIILQLQGKDLKQIKEDFLLHNIALVDGMKNLEVDIEWLRVLLNDMLEAKQPLREKLGKLKEKRDSNRKTIEDAESKLRECEERERKLSALLESTLDEKIVWKETLGKAKDESTRITQTIKSSMSKAKRFYDCSPMDDLL